MGYNRILIALDIDDVCEDVLQKGLEMVSDSESEICVLHVVKPLADEYSIVTAPNINELAEAFEREVTDAARTRLMEIVGVRGAEIEIEMGYPVKVIHERAEEWAADLIVMGSHGKKGFQLLGSTANGVLHGAPCNVLTVRV